ncbi:NADPH:quinone oxidoreductase family protein [Pseudonocardia sp. KRD-184]|uniref:NADPH:quinone oxidoreductase family protein n=1 Tax=Pseudonocardia oceani TaxID=2792013 RepID=A0ABS6UET0_9PSEU|nr:NADPH:quinone oxidoreductase family protein [Pseudonocardia oceani]MBW0090420.1 NADPH:quinone oxidoreductase family protein [Pseudonocardia oceani]MBW0097853.1 NADPH:quinone oxidoreductase family protein [Pseudonocardia oceani]MBW0110356.1 NADPH:quinone oxidoreductase family protein [Pseudonocardia oceani]MBW0124487.1 NADPH:quinone oxidoreductase family protein [Pseudonocardia oceani]MBW0130741.1 NADPH:quinone oxidoreductase family protein [Pseudonocardia oceani]
MRAVQVVRLEGPAAVEVRDVPEPDRGADQVLIDVRAAGVNFPDVLQSKGLYQYKPDLPFTLGSEIAGVVREAPEGAAVRSGDRVAAFTTVGAFAEVVAAPAGYVFPLPDEVSFAAGACLPMNYLTAQFALRRRGHLEAGQRVLVQGAAGGVGTACVQLAAALGAEVVAVVSTEEKAEVARRAGAAHAVLVEGFRDAVKELGGVDLVVDPVGGDRFTDSLRCLRPEGRLLVIGFTAGDIPTVKVNRLLLNNIDVVGVGWGAFAMPRDGFVAEQWDDLLPHLRSGALDPVVGATYPLADAAAALAEIDERRVTGKIVLEP